MKHEQLLKIKNWRLRLPDELVIDCDNKEYGNLAVKQICILLSARGYRIEIYSHKGKSYHAHIKNIPHIAELPKEQNQQYLKKLLEKYIQETKQIIGDKFYLNDIDLSMCRYGQPIAEENKQHYRTGKIKKLIGVVNSNLKNFCEIEIYNQVVSEEKQYNPQITSTGITAEIIKRVSIINIAREFGLQVDNNGMALCPFHDDTNKSLKFYEQQGKFCCFSNKCRSEEGNYLTGNIIFFYALMERLKNETPNRNL